MDNKKIIIKMKPEVREKVIEICKKFNNDPGELINVLHQTQDFLGYLPAEVQELIAEELHMPTAKVYGVVSFYAFFTMTPKGKYPVSVCMGTACYVRGGEKILDAFKKELARPMPTVSSPSPPCAASAPAALPPLL